MAARIVHVSEVATELDQDSDTGNVVHEPTAMSFVGGANRDQLRFMLDEESFTAFEAALDAPAPVNAKLKTLLTEPPPWENCKGIQFV